MESHLIRTCIKGRVYTRFKSLENVLKMFYFLFWYERTNVDSANNCKNKTEQRGLSVQV